MPYTQSSHRSPLSSGPASNARSGRFPLLPSQFTTTSTESQGSQGPKLPRSTLASYHHMLAVKTTPSVSDSNAETISPSTADGEKNVPVSHLNASLRRPPSSVTDESYGPIGVIPESSQNSSDDRSTKPEKRQMEEPSEQQDAIKSVEQHRASSPNIVIGANRLGSALTIITPKHEDMLKGESKSEGRVLSPSARKISHPCSYTDSSPLMGKVRQHQADTPTSESDGEGTDDSENERTKRKPPMIRKRSGELVRPALRPSTRGRPSSTPGIPKLSKSVCFDGHLEDIRYFDQSLAINAVSPPIEPPTSDAESLFGDDDYNLVRSPSFEWEIIVANFPAETVERLQLPVRVEGVYLSSDNKMLAGSVAVANLAFHKYVVVRFTLDYWKTTSEVSAEFSNDIRRNHQNDGYDWFNFTIKLADIANLETKTMFFCIKYCVNGVEYWDNNNNMNFQVDFRKKMKPIYGKKGMQANGLLRSAKKSLPGSDRPAHTFADFADGFNATPSIPPNDYLEDNGRLKGVGSAPTLTSGSLARKPSNTGGHTFSSRYDFDMCISAAIQAANKPSTNSSNQPQKTSLVKRSVAVSTSEPAPNALIGGAGSHHLGPNLPRRDGVRQPSLDSQSYNELIKKYCYVCA